MKRPQKQGMTLGGFCVLAVATCVGYGVVNGDIDLGGIGSGTGAGVKPAAGAAGVAGIPKLYLDLYRLNAGRCPQADAPTLAAQGYVESDHGRSPLPGVHSGHNGVQARGPMQIKPAAWSEVGEGPYLVNVYKPGPAIEAAAKYVCKYDLDQYGGGGSYVSQVEAKADDYRAAGV